MNSYTLKELAELTESEVVGDANYVITNVEDLASAGPNDISFLANLRYEQQMKKSKAGAIFIHPSSPRPENRNLLLNSNPSLAFQKTLELFFNPSLRESGFKGIHPTAVIHPDAEIDPTSTIMPYAVIDRAAKIGKNTIIGAHVYVGCGSQIGEECVLYPHSVVRENCILNNRIILQPGAVIGSCGFGYNTDQKGHHLPLKHVGNVIIEDDVEIGANTTIDRARFKTTLIKRGTKIDNLVQIAHNVTIGEDNLIVAQVGIAGSSKTGKHVVMAGQSALVGHIELEDGVVLAGRAAASKSLPKGVYGGAPAVPMKDFNEQVIYLKNLSKFVKRLEKLEKLLSVKESKEEKNEQPLSSSN